MAHKVLFLARIVLPEEYNCLIYNTIEQLAVVVECNTNKYTPLPASLFQPPPPSHKPRLLACSCDDNYVLYLMSTSDTCRRKKVRCDGIQPACTNCITFGFQCT